MYSLFRSVVVAGLLCPVWFAAGDNVTPLPFHDLAEYTGEVPAPWAPTLAGGALRTLAIAPYSALEDIARLRAHLPLDLETVAVWDHEHLGFDPRFPEPYYPDAAYEVVEKRLARLLDKKKIDVIIIGQCRLAMFPPAIQQQIIEQVNSGTGLVVIRAGDAVGDEDPLSTWLRDTPDTPEPAHLTQGVGPLGIDQQKETELVRTRTAGEGRIVSLDVQNAPSTNHCLVPIPDNPYALVSEHESNAFSLVCKAIQWAAHRESPDRISHLVDVAPKGPDDDEIPPGYPPEFIASIRKNAFNNPVRPFVLHLEEPSTTDYNVAYQIRHTGAGLPAIRITSNTVLPKGATYYPLDIIASPGNYTVDIWLESRKGVATWHTETITVNGWPRLSKISITHDDKPAVWLHPNDHLDIALDVEPIAFFKSGQEATVFARAIDSFDRQVASASRTVGPDGGPLGLRLELADLIAPLIQVEIFAVPSTLVSESALIGQAARQIYFFPVRLPDPPLEPRLIISSQGPFDYGALRQLDSLRKIFGADALHAPLGTASLLVAGESGLGRIAQIGTLDNGHVGPGMTRIPCLSDPAYQAREAERVKAGILEAWAGGAPFYSLGAGCALTSTDADVCQGPHCLARFRDYLQRDYASLEALNLAWGAQFTRWEDVVPQTMDQCLQTDRWAPWLDFRMAMNDVFTTTQQQARETVRSVDGAGRTGFQALDMPSGPLSGYNWRDLSIVNDFIAAPPEATILRRLQSYHRGHPYTGILLGRDRLLPDPAQAAWIPWDAIVRQIPAIWLDAPVGVGPRGMVSPLGEPKPGLAALGDSLRTIQDGIGTLLLNARPHATGIAIADSPPSRYLDFADPEPGRTADEAEAWLENALNQMGFSITVRTLTDDLQGINTIILSRTRALANEEVAALKAFHNQNGLILADGQPGILDIHGAPRPNNPLPFLHPLDPEHPEDEFSLWTNRPVWVSAIEGAPENKAILAQLLVRAGNEPALPIRLPDKQVGAVERFQYQFGAATIIACLPNPNVETTTRRARLDLPDKHFGVDLLHPMEVRPRGRIQWTVEPGTPALFSILPYEVKEIKALVPESVVAGQRLPIDVLLNTGDSVPGTHLLLIRLERPDGSDIPHYRRCLPLDDGALNTYLPLAENERPGYYTLVLREVLTRQEIALRVEIL